MRRTHVRGLRWWIAMLTLLSGGAAQAGISDVAAGASLPQLLGNASQTLNRTFGLQAEILYEEAWLGEYLALHFAGSYHPYQIRNLSTINLNIAALFAGVALQSAPGLLGSSLFLALDVGGAVDWYTYSGVSNTQAVSAILAAGQVVPGLDVPVFKKFGVKLEFPLQAIFTRSPIYIWNGSLSLRWRL